jgi:hypothetical protein
MSDPNRDDEYPGRDDSFDIDIDGFEDSNFPAPKDANEEFPPEAFDLEFDQVIKRIDDLGPLDSLGPPLDFEPPEVPVVIPKPPVKVRESSPIPAPPVEGGTILLTERLIEDPPEFLRPTSPIRATDPIKATDPIRATDHLDKPGTSPEPATVAQLSPEALSSLIEKAVEKGLLEALAIRAAQKKKNKE